jgi:hypothetical protein
MQLRQEVQQVDSLSSPKSMEEETVTARALSPDMGDVQIMKEKDGKPWFFLTVDCQAFYNSNVLYASSIDNTFSAWQIITTPEIGFAPQIQDEQYSKFFPKAGFRYQFYSYAQADPGKQNFATTGISSQNFQVANPYGSIGWAFTDDLFLEFSVQANIYNGNGRDWSQYNNFLDEYPLAWQATWFKSFAEIQSVSVTARASYVLANPSNFERTDNNLTFAWVTNPIRELNTQIYASFRLAKYTGIQLPPPNFDNYDRLDFQMTYGASVTWTPLEHLSLRGFVSWTKSDSTQVEETGTFEAFNAGTGLNLIYRF